MSETTQPKDWRWQSPYPVKETMDRLLSVVNRYPEVLKFNRIDQQEVASRSGKKVKPVEVTFFENSQLVGKLLAANIEAATQLPIKATVWEDGNGKVWLQTTNIDALRDNFNLNGAEGAVDAIYKLLPVWVEEAISK